ncbi:MAG TPA: heparan-alpha-glucosaminide N-acetyltransferase domain-containing protein [Caulobacteraceae bacterium]|nr:heparan-alpha-glucosaminide N-acetyltransferase domain-containing protein [Caulobacteraceae bacterium]
MSAVAQVHLATDAEPAGPLRQGLRLTSIDLLRGLIIVLMVLDHVRDYFMAGAFFTDAVDPRTSWPALYATRWITHLCAPGFVFLAGVSAFLKGVRDDDTRSLSWFLFSRGLWLILLELTVINVGWNFALGAPFLQVIWAIGAGMILLSALVWLGPRAVLAIGVAIVAGHNLLAPINPPHLGEYGIVWNLALEPGFPQLLGSPMFVAYPLLPWLGIMCLGYGLGHVFLVTPGERIRTLLFLGLTFVAAFALLRWLNVYGDPGPWTAQSDPVRTAMSVMNVQKYPPSLQFILVTLGISLLLLAAFERLRGPVAEFFLTYGRVPLFVYVLHIYLIHGLQLLVGTMVAGRPASDFVLVFANPAKQEGWGYGLGVVYLVWAVVLALLFPLARWFGRVKRERRDWWLSYL